MKFPKNKLEFMTWGVRLWSKFFISRVLFFVVLIGSFVDGKNNEIYRKLAGAIEALYFSLSLFTLLYFSYSLSCTISSEINDESTDSFGSKINSIEYKAGNGFAILYDNINYEVEQLNRLDTKIKKGLRNFFKELNIYNIKRHSRNMLFRSLSRDDRVKLSRKVVYHIFFSRQLNSAKIKFFIWLIVSIIFSSIASTFYFKRNASNAAVLFSAIASVPMYVFFINKEIYKILFNLTERVLGRFNSIHRRLDWMVVSCYRLKESQISEKRKSTRIREIVSRGNKYLNDISNLSEKSVTSYMGIAKIKTLTQDYRKYVTITLITIALSKLFDSSISDVDILGRGMRILSIFELAINIYFTFIYFIIVNIEDNIIAKIKNKCINFYASCTSQMKEIIPNKLSAMTYVFSFISSILILVEEEDSIINSKIFFCAVACYTLSYIFGELSVIMFGKGKDYDEISAVVTNDYYFTKILKFTEHNNSFVTHSNFDISSDSQCLSSYSSSKSSSPTSSSSSSTSSST